jgi:hypothetical protein
VTWGLASVVANAFHVPLRELMVGVKAALGDHGGRGDSNGLEEAKMGEGWR